MSTAAMEWARRQVTGDARRKFVLLTLANYADQDGYAWPSIERLASDTELTPQAIRNTMRELIDIRLIARHPDADMKDQRYRIDVVKLGPRENDDPAMLCALRDSPYIAKKRSKAKTATIVVTQDQFDMFWRNYPNKTGVGAAQKKFVQVLKSEQATFNDLLVGLERYINKADDREWCHAATWLNQKRWLDGPVDPVNKGKVRGISRPAI